LPIYVGLTVHTETKNKNYVNQLHKLGLCITYNMVLEIENGLAHSVIRRYQEDGKKMD
jgi:hypothetical protein